MNRLGLTALRYWPLVLVLAIVQPRYALAQSSSRIVVPAGTLIPVRIISRVSSSTATPGDTLNLRAASDVSVDGWIVIRKGAIGQGEIVASVPSNAHGQIGMLSLQMDWITLADGHRAHLSTQRATGETEAVQPQPMVIRTNAGDVHLDGSLELPAFTNDNVVVVATTRAASEAEYAPMVATVPTPSPTPEPTPTPTPKRTPTPTPETTPTPTPRSTPTPTPEPTATPTPRPTSTPTMMPTPAVVETLPPRAPAPRPTTVPVPSPAPTAFPEGATIFETRGTGPRVTLPFSAPSAWALTYTYDCTHQHDVEPSFSLRIAGAPIYVAPIEGSDRRATATVYMHQSGMFYLQIDTPCSWHVRAFSQALNSNVGWLGMLR